MRAGSRTSPPSAVNRRDRLLSWEVAGKCLTRLGYRARKGAPSPPEAVIRRESGDALRRTLGPEATGTTEHHRDFPRRRDRHRPLDRLRTRLAVRYQAVADDGVRVVRDCGGIP